MRNDIAATVLTPLVLAGGAAVMSACNTTSGIGKDLAATGDAITDTAERAN